MVILWAERGEVSLSSLYYWRSKSQITLSANKEQNEALNLGLPTEDFAC